MPIADLLHKEAQKQYGKSIYFLCSASRDKYFKVCKGKTEFDSTHFWPAVVMWLQWSCRSFLELIEHFPLTAPFVVNRVKKIKLHSNKLDSTHHCMHALECLFFSLTFRISFYQICRNMLRSIWSIIIL